MVRRPALEGTPGGAVPATGTGSPGD
jgi:hypothetical protein